ncbi:unnamed protein product [Rhodiola kirilowii]
MMQSGTGLVPPQMAQNQQYQQQQPQQQPWMLAPHQPMWNQQSQIPPQQQFQQQPQQQQQYAQPGNPNEIRTLWIGDLQYWMDENYVYGCFAQTNEVVNVKLIRNKVSNQLEGYGFIEFVSREAAERVLQTYSGTLMPNVEQNYRLNWASAGERRNDDTPEYTIFVGDCTEAEKRHTRHKRIESQEEGDMSSMRRRLEIPDWSDMPLDMANSILDKLPEVVEHIRFGAVCKNWYIILKQYVKPASCCNVLPMLLLPSLSRNVYRLFALSSLGKHYSNLQLPLPYSDRTYIGTTHGWFATQNCGSSFTLVYPFGREIRKIFYLPHLRRLSWDYDLNVNRLVISPDSTPSDYTIVATYSQRNEFATIKAGENSWVFIDTQSDSFFNDIIFHQGAAYLVDHLSKIIKVDVHSRPPVIKAVHHLLGNTEEQHTTYLVESTSSDLYLLQRFYHDHNRYMTSRFNIFKLKVEGEQLIAKKKSKGMKGDTFFIGDTSMACKSNGCIPNAIYFEDYLLYRPKCNYIVANYSIEDGAIRNVYEAGFFAPRPIWIVPQQHFAPK